MMLNKFPPGIELARLSLGSNEEKGVIATQNFSKGEIIHKLGTVETTYPTRTSLQVGDHKYVEDFVGQYINHNCNPSATIINVNLVCIRDIPKGEEITFDYNANEDVVSHPFICHCCGKIITGRKDTLYRHMLIWIKLHFRAQQS